LEKHKEYYSKRINNYMPSLVFNNQIVPDPTSYTPDSLNLTSSLSGVSFGSAGANAKAVLFNAKPSSQLSNVNQTYTVTVEGVATTISIDDAYDTETFALLLTDDRSYTFVVNSGGPTADSLTNNRFDSVGPEKRRLWNLNG